MAQGTPGDVVSFALSGTSTYGIAIGNPDTTHTTVAYGFLGYPAKDRNVHVKETDTTSVTVLGAAGTGQ